jgi:hypothetical protein
MSRTDGPAGTFIRFFVAGDLLGWAWWSANPRAGSSPLLLPPRDGGNGRTELSVNPRAEQSHTVTHLDNTNRTSSTPVPCTVPKLDARVVSWGFVSSP